GGGEPLRTQQRADGEPDVAAKSLGGVEPPVAPDAADRVARERDVAEFLQRRETRGSGILAAVDPLLDADREVAANLLVEIVDVGRHALLLAGRRRVHDASDRVHELRPSIALAQQLFFARRREL